MGQGKIWIWEHKSRETGKRLSRIWSKETKLSKGGGIYWWEVRKKKDRPAKMVAEIKEELKMKSWKNEVEWSWKNEGTLWKPWGQSRQHGQRRGDKGTRLGMKMQPAVTSLQLWVCLWSSCSLVLVLDLAVPMHVGERARMQQPWEILSSSCWSEFLKDNSAAHSVREQLVTNHEWRTIVCRVTKALLKTTPKE